MTHTYVVKNLCEDPSEADIAKAFALIQAVYGQATRREWENFAQSRATRCGINDAQEGIVIAKGDSGYVHGLFSYRVMAKSLHGTSLDCDHFILPDLLRVERVLAALLEEAEELARRFHCTNVNLALPSTSWASPVLATRMSAAIEKTGYRPDRFYVFKSLEQDAENGL